MKTVIFVDTEGNASALADDRMDHIQTLGEKIVERVSNVEYDHEHQCWVATDLEGNVISRSNVRSEVIESEREYFNQLMQGSFCKKK